MKMHGLPWHMSVRNPFAQAKLPMQRTFYGDDALLGMLDCALEDLVLSSGQTVAESPCLRIIYADADGAEIDARVARIATHMGSAIAQETARLDNTDWAAKMQEDFPAFRVGRFYVHGNHDPATCPTGSTSLLIDAAAAFGTGEHATTWGCMLALQQLRKQNRHATRILDMGCGTAILALAAAHLWPSARVDAVDNDVAAVHVAAHNIRANRLQGRIATWQSNGPNHVRLQRNASYPVIVANILAVPLMQMAHALCGLLAPNGHIILSGLLASQTRMVLHAYALQGMRLVVAYEKDGWMTLQLAR